MHPGSSVDAPKFVILNERFVLPEDLLSCLCDGVWLLWIHSQQDLQVVETRVSSEFVVLKNVSKSWITSWHPIFCPVILVKQPFDLFQFLITSQPSLSIPPPMIRYLKEVLKAGYESLSEIIVCPYFNLISELGNGWLVMIVMASAHKESMMKATRPGRVIAKSPRRSNLSSQCIVLLCRVVQSWLSKEKSPGQGNNELLHSMPRAK